MVAKIYGLIWALGALAVVAFYLTGNFTPLVAIVFGFLSFGALFLGIVSVLPLTVEHQLSKKH